MQLIVKIVWLLLRLLEVMLLWRAILSWLPLSPDSRIRRFVRDVTEPLLLPVRTLLYGAFPSLERFPFDISFIIVFIVIQILASLL